MTKKYWLGVMLFSVFMLGGSGYFIWMTLQQKTASEVPLKEVISQADQSTASLVDTSSPTAPSADIQSVKSDSSAPDEKQKGNTSQKRNILFTYRKASAKEVFIIGTFNQWKRESMKKNEKGLWEYYTKLSPGQYEYKFVVDDRKIKDPNNRLYTPKGNSILKVKPLADQ